MLVKGRIPSCMILQKWKGSDMIHVTVTNSTEGSIILANRFSVTDVTADGDDETLSTLRLFGDNELLMQLAVKPLDPKKEGKMKEKAEPAEAEDEEVQA